MQIPEEPPFITGTMHGRNKKDNLTDSAAYKSAAQFGYTEIVKNPEDS